MEQGNLQNSSVPAEPLATPGSRADSFAARKLRGSELARGLVRRLLNPLELGRAIRLHVHRKAHRHSFDDAQLALYSKILPSEFLHFGYFKNPDQRPETISLADLSEAQERYARLILDRVGDPGDPRGPILDVGCGMGGLSRMLRSRGFSVVALTPDRLQAAHVQATLPDVPVLRTKLEQLPADEYAARFDAIITAESLQYLKLDLALPVLGTILRPGGRWIACDYFHLRPSPDRSCHLWDEYQQKLAQHGWVISFQRDITPNVLPTLAYVHMWATRLGLPLMDFSFLRLRRKQPGLHYLLGDVLTRLERFARANVEIIDPVLFAEEKRYMLLVMERAPQPCPAVVAAAPHADSRDKIADLPAAAAVPDKSGGERVWRGGWIDLLGGPIRAFARSIRAFGVGKHLFGAGKHPSGAGKHPSGAGKQASGAGKHAISDRTGWLPNRGLWLAIALFALVAFALVFARAMGRRLNVDENVFVASGALLSRHGILPYRDYHYNHMPTLVLVYAGLFKLSDHLLLAARTFSAACAAATAATLFGVAAHRLRALGRQRWGWACAAGVLLLTNPLFTYTSGLAWNHDFPVLMSLLGFLALWRTLSSPRPMRWAGLSGLLVGLAVTTRLTFAPAVAGYVLFLLLRPGATARDANDRLRDRRRDLLAFFAGLVLAALPSIWMWAQAPGNAFFGNVLYPALNTKYHFENDPWIRRPFSLIEKLLYVLKSLFKLPGNGLLVIGFVAALAALLRPRRARTDGLQCLLLSLVIIVIMLMAAGFAPAPLYGQYLYAATPFMLLGVVILLPRIARRIESAGAAARPFMTGALAMSVIAIAIGATQYHSLFALPAARSWVPMQVHQTGLAIARQAAPGRVLTLQPIYPLEGGLDVYEELATGRYELRVATYLSESQELRYRMPCGADLSKLAEVCPPADVLMFDGGREGDLRGYQQALLSATSQQPYAQVIIDAATPSKAASETSIRLYRRISTAGAMPRPEICGDGSELFDLARMCDGKRAAASGQETQQHLGPVGPSLRRSAPTREERITG